MATWQCHAARTRQDPGTHTAGPVATGEPPIQTHPEKMPTGPRAVRSQQRHATPLEGLSILGEWVLPNQPRHRHPVRLHRPQRAPNLAGCSAPGSSVGLCTPTLAARPCLAPSPFWHGNEQVPRTGGSLLASSLPHGWRRSTNKHSPSATRIRVLILCSKAKPPPAVPAHHETQERVQGWGRAKPGPH